MPTVRAGPGPAPACYPPFRGGRPHRWCGLTSREIRTSGPVRYIARVALRVVLADDSFLVREGVTKLLADSEVTVLEGVGDAPALLAAVHRH